MKRTFAAIALAGALVAHAQEPVYRWGPPATNDFTERRVERLLDLGDQGFVLLRVSQDATTVKHFWLERFDRTLASVGMRGVAFNGGVMGDSYDLDEVLTINGQGLYAFVTHWEKAAGKHTLLLHPGSGRCVGRGPGDVRCGDGREDGEQWTLHPLAEPRWCASCWC